VSVEIRLDPNEVRLAVYIGSTRQLTNLYQGRRDRNGAERLDGWGLHIEGAGAEIAVAKYLGVYFMGGLFRGDDVGPFQVKLSRKCAELIVREFDDPMKTYVLVHGTLPKLTLRGWTYGYCAKQLDYRANHGGYGVAYFYPPDALFPIEALHEHLASTNLVRSPTIPTR